jgi:hypothetical protein
MKDYLGQDLKRGDQVVWASGNNGSADLRKAWVVGPRGSLSVTLEEPYLHDPSKFRTTYRDLTRVLKIEHTPGSTYQVQTPDPSIKKPKKEKKTTETKVSW